jgi:Rrf2 family protein
MLRLTKRVDYGMMAMRYLAEHTDRGAHSARDIADAYNLPLPLLAKVLQQLTKADLTVSHAGPTGGYTLARPAQNINTLDVISALDGPLGITGCTTLGSECEAVQYCPIREPLQRVNDSIRMVLTNITVADLAKSVPSPASPD